MGKAAPLLRSDKQGKDAGERQLRGARATAAARTRGHSAWGKRHVPKAGRDCFTPAAMPKSGGTALSLSAVTKVSPGILLCSAADVPVPIVDDAQVAGAACSWFCSQQCSVAS